MKTQYLTALKRNYKFDFSWMITKDNKQLFNEFKSNVNLKTALIYLKNILKENIKFWKENAAYVNSDLLENLIKSTMIIEHLINNLKVPENLFNPNKFKIYLKENFEIFFDEFSDILNFECDCFLPQTFLIKIKLIFITFNIINEKFNSSLIRLNFEEDYNKSLILAQSYYQKIKDLFK